MGKPTGFLEYKRSVAGQQPVAERLKHYREFSERLSEEAARQQGARCMDCGIPFCHTAFGCPVYNRIPDWNDLVYHSHWKEAWEQLEHTNNFPEITGRVCPAPCEPACTLSVNDSPVTIKQIELAIIEKAFEKGWVVPRMAHTRSGKSVAVVGSGPAGLAAAQQLARFGHAVTLFEKAPKIGGLLRYGIPDFKLEKQVIDRRLKQMEAEGVRFETNVRIGDDLSARYLIKTFDAVLLAIGSEFPRDLNIPGRELPGIHFAMDYLSKSNLRQDGLLQESEWITARNKRVLVIGGGDTGADCVGIANRQGAQKVYQFEILPRPPDWKHSWNPDWPHWPNILRNSSSHEEGCEREWAVLTREFRPGRNGSIVVSFSRIAWEVSEDGRSGAMTEISDSGFTLEVDLVLLAMGFLYPKQDGIIRQLGLEKNERSNIRIDSGYRTSVERVYAAGDATTGASLVVRAIYQGREAAGAIHEELTR